MAIVQASLVEDLMSRHEKAVLRGVYRASQLNEGLVQLQRIKDHLQRPESRGGTNVLDDDSLKRLEEYLTSAIRSALVSTKTPAKSDDNKGHVQDAKQ